MASYENELLARMVALEIEALASIGVPADAKPYFFHTQEAFPYFTNRIAANGVTDDGSEVFDINNPLIIMRLVVGHVTEGYKGEPESNLYEWGPVVKTYIQSCQWLQSAAYPDRMNRLFIGHVSDNGGFRVFENSGIGVQQVGRELQYQCSISEVIEQVYY